MRLLGIDPGKTGALALYDRERTAASGLRWLILDMPAEVAVIRDWLRKHAPDHAALEYVTPMLGWGTVPSFRLGESSGKLQAVLACCDVPTLRVVPAQWKRHHGLLKTGKKESRALAEKLFPELQGTLGRVIDGRADAVLIAAYAVQRFASLI